MRAWWGVALILAGCPNGGSSGDTSKHLVWVDKTGAVVGQSSGSNAVLWADSSGVLWPIDPETAAFVHPLTTATHAYAEANCQSVGVVIGAPPPRVPFVIAGEDGIWLRPDDLASTSATPVALKTSDGACGPVGDRTPRATIPKDQLKPLTSPSIPFAPPLHQELR
jgi:hypothetical protein